MHCSLFFTCSEQVGVEVLPGNITFLTCLNPLTLARVSFDRILFLIQAKFNPNHIGKKVST